MNKETNKTYWNNWGGNYSNVWHNVAKQALSKKEMALINKYLLNYVPKKILDIGVGNGRILENIMENGKGDLEIYGIDVSEKMVDICREKFRGVSFVKSLEVCDVSKAEVCFDEKFDLITVIRVLKYNQNWKEILGRIHKSLNKDGVCIFSMPNSHSMAGIKRDTFSDDKIAINYTNKRELKQISKKIGFKICEVIGFSRMPNFFYNLSSNRIYVGLLLLIEDILRMIFGKSFLTRYFFVIIRK